MRSCKAEVRRLLSDVRDQIAARNEMMTHEREEDRKYLELGWNRGTIETIEARLVEILDDGNARAKEGK